MLSLRGMGRMWINYVVSAEQCAWVQIAFLLLSIHVDLKKWLNVALGDFLTCNTEMLRVGSSHRTAGKPK